MNEVMNVHAAKTNLSKLLTRVANGEEIVIAKDGVPVAKLVPYDTSLAPRALGAFAGKLWLTDDAFETPDWLVDAFDGTSGQHAVPIPPPGQPERMAEPRRGPSIRRRGA